MAVFFDRWGEVEVLPRVAHISEQRFFVYDSIFENGLNQNCRKAIQHIILIIIYQKRCYRV